MLKYIFIGLCILNTCFSFCELSSEKSPKYYRTLDTIGDSITWGGVGSKLRCLLDLKHIKYDFMGAYVDGYGYRHDGHGGDSTDDVLSRIDTIPKSDNYFLLIGVNDIKQTALYSYSNIIKIAEHLNIKNPIANIYISTLLPVTGNWPNYNTRNNEVNKLLRERLNCSNCILIDLGGYFSSIPNWSNLMLDGLHPNLKGYQMITDYLVLKII